MKTNMNTKNYFSILLASALALCGNAAWAEIELLTGVEVDPTSTFTPTRIINGGFDTEPWEDFVVEGVRYTKENRFPYASKGHEQPIEKLFPNGIDEGWNTTECVTYDDTIFEWATTINNYWVPKDNTHLPFAELCACNLDVLSQDLTTHGGDVILWTLRHGFRGYVGAQSMRVEIGAPNGAATGVAASANSNIKPETKATYIATGVTNPTGTTYGYEGSLGNLSLPSGSVCDWYDVSGIYVIPEGQTVTRFAFIPITPNNGGGNLMDDLTFSTIIGNLKAVVNADNSVTITGYWGDENEAKHLCVEIDEVTYNLDMSGIHSQNFIVTIPYAKVGDASSFNVYHEDYPSVKRTVSIQHANQFKIVADGATFRAWCTNELHSVETGCPHHGEANALEMQLDAASVPFTGLPYDGVALTGETNEWVKTGLPMPTEYSYAARGTLDFVATPPTALGLYTARGEIKGEFATDDFEIIVPPASDWAKLQKALTNDAAASLTCDAFEHTYENGTNFVKLLKNVVANTNVDTHLVIPTNSIAVLDLKGFTLDRGLAGLCTDIEDDGAPEDGEVIFVSGQLTVQDTSDAQDGKITGGCGCRAGGVLVGIDDYNKDYLDPGIGDYARFVLKSGSICGNFGSDGEDNGVGGLAGLWGGEIVMLGGSVVDNIGLVGGGAGNLFETESSVIPSRIDLRGGVISGNTGFNAGGFGCMSVARDAVCIGGTVVITNNFGMYVGGVFSLGLTLGGRAVIKDNVNNGGFRDWQNVIVMAEGESLSNLPPLGSETDPIEEGAEIWVALMGNDWETEPIVYPVRILTNCTAAAAQCFRSEIPGTTVFFQDDALWIGEGSSTPEGSPENPWKVGAEGAEEMVQAYTNGNGKVIVTGTGVPKTFAAGEEPWAGAEPAIKEILVPQGMVGACQTAWPAEASKITDGKVGVEEFTVVRGEDGSYLVKPLLPAPDSADGVNWLLLTFTAESQREVASFANALGVDFKTAGSRISAVKLMSIGATVTYPVASDDNGYVTLPAGTESFVLARATNDFKSGYYLQSVGGVAGLGGLLPGEMLGNQIGLPAILTSSCSVSGGQMSVALTASNAKSGGGVYGYSVVLRLAAQIGDSTVVKNLSYDFDEVFTPAEEGLKVRSGQIDFNCAALFGVDKLDTRIDVTVRIESRKPSAVNTAAIFNDTPEAANAAIQAWLADPNAETFDGWVESTMAKSEALEDGSDAMLRFNKDLAHVFAALIKSALVYDNPGRHNPSSVDMVKCNLRSDILFRTLADLMYDHESAIAYLPRISEELRKAGEDVDGFNYLAELRSSIRNGTLPKGLRELLDRYYSILGFGEAERATALSLFDDWLKDPANDEWNFEKLFKGDLYGLTEEQVAAKAETATAEDMYSAINSAFCTLWLTFDSAVSCGNFQVQQGFLTSDIVFNAIADLIEVLQGGHRNDVLCAVYGLGSGLSDEFEKYFEESTDLVAKQYRNLRMLERFGGVGDDRPALMSPRQALAANGVALDYGTARKVREIFASWLADSSIDKNGPNDWIQATCVDANYDMSDEGDAAQAYATMAVLLGVSDAIRQSGDAVLIAGLEACATFNEALAPLTQAWVAPGSPMAALKFLGESIMYADAFKPIFESHSEITDNTKLFATVRQMMRTHEFAQVRQTLEPAAMIVTDNGAATNLYYSVQAAFDSEFTVDMSVTNTITLLRDYTETRMLDFDENTKFKGTTVFGCTSEMIEPRYQTVRLDLNGHVFVGGSAEKFAVDMPSELISEYMSPTILVGMYATLIIDDSSEGRTGVICKPESAALFAGVKQQVPPAKPQLGASALSYYCVSLIASVGSDVVLAGGKLVATPVGLDGSMSGKRMFGVFSRMGSFTMTGGTIAGDVDDGESGTVEAYGIACMNSKLDISGGKVKDAIIAQSGTVSISGGLFGTDDVKNNESKWLAPDHICVKNDDAATLAEGYNWAVFQPTEGSKWNPWKIGPDGSDTPTAYKNQTGELVIEGEGQVVKTPWLDDKDGITEIAITDPGTELPEGAFEDMGSDDDKINLNLPDNWKGDLPDEDGNWYGAKVQIETWPLMIRNVRFQQRYPWNGLVDVTADVYGPETNEIVLCVSAHDGEEKLRVKTLDGDDRVFGLTNGLKPVHFVWDAGEDIGTGFRSENITVNVEIEPDEVVVWEGEAAVDSWDGVYFGEEEGLSHLPVGTEVRLYIHPLRVNEDVRLQEFEGHWNGRPFVQYIDDKTVPAGVLERGYVSFIMNDDVVDLLNTPTQGWGGALVVQGINCCVTSVTYIRPSKTARTTIWEGSFYAPAGWGGMGDLSWGGFDWSSVEVGKVLEVYYTTSPEYGDYQMRIADGGWTALPSAQTMPGADSNGNAWLAASPGVLRMVITQADKDALLLNNSGLVVCGSMFTVYKIAIADNIPKPRETWSKRAIWEGDFSVGWWDNNMPDLSNDVFDWSQVRPGSVLSMPFTLAEDRWYDDMYWSGMIRIADSNWDALPSWWELSGGDPDGNCFYDYDGEATLTLQQEDIDALEQTDGLLICGAWFNINTIYLSALDKQPDPVKIAAAAEAGRIDLRRPIIVAPGESDTITYSESQWGGQSRIGTVDIHFGWIPGEVDLSTLRSLPVVFTNLKGDGTKTFTYPEKTGTYAYVHECIPPENENAFVQMPLVAPVIVAWYIGADDPKSVYAIDRGDGEIVIAGEGYMKDFNGCGPWGTDITGVTINNGVRNVGANAFKGCTQMTHAELPESMEEIGNGAFAGDTALETIWSNAWYPPWFLGDPFTGVTKEEVIVYVPDDDYVYEQYEYNSDWAPFWNRSQSYGYEFYFEVYSYEGVSRKVTVDGEVLYEGADYFDRWISYGSKVEVTATITDDSYLFDDGSTEKTFTWNFWNHEDRIEREIAPYGADWITLQMALAGTPFADSRDAVDYNNVDGTNVVMLLKDISTRSHYDRTLVVTNAAVLDLAGHVVYYGNGYDSVIGVGSLYWELVPAQQQQQQQRLAEKGLQEVGQVAWEEDVAYQEVRHLLPAWLNIVDTVGGGRITKSGGMARMTAEKGEALTASAHSGTVEVGYNLAGGITVLPESVCIMDGGVITGCYGASAGGVYNGGLFVLTGGEISGNVCELPYFVANEANVDSALGKSAVETLSCDGIVNVSGAELVITGGKVRDGIYNVEDNRVPAQQQIAVLDDRVPAQQQIAVLDDEFAEQSAYVAPVVEISGGYFGANVALDRAWIVEGYEPIPNAEFAGYDKKVILTPPEVAEARTQAKEEIEKKAGLDMTRSEEMDDLVEEAFEAIDTAYPVENVETVFAEYLAKVVDQYAKDNPGVPQTLTATGTLDLRSQRELPYGVDTVEGITYSDSTWGRDAMPGTVTITQQNLETGKKMAVVENQWGTSEGTSVQLVGQNTDETGLGHKLFHTVRGTVLESFVTFFFSGFERGKPSNPWDGGPEGHEDEIQVSVDDDPNADPAPGKKLVVDGEGNLTPAAPNEEWRKYAEEITEIYVASGIVLNVGSLAGYPNLQRIIFEDPNYRLPREAMNGYEYYEEGYGWRWVDMTCPSDGVYVEQFNGRQKVTAFYDTDSHHVADLYEAWDNGFNPILFSTVPRDLIDTFPQGTEFEPITDELGDLQGWKVILQNDINGTVYLPDNLGWVVIDLNGHDIRGKDGYYDEWDDKRRHGRPAFQIEHDWGEEGGEPLVLEFIDSKPDATPDVVGGKGLDGAPAGSGAPAIIVFEDVLEGVKVIAGPNVTVKGGDAGTGLGYDVPAGEPASYGEPEELVEAIEGGKVEYGDAAESDVTAWAKCYLGTTPPADWLMNLPQGVSYVNGSFWFWRRVGDKHGPATFDFNELPLALIASAGITSANIEFVPGEIEVDTITAPVNFSFRFVGSDGGMRRQEKKAVLEKEKSEKEDGKLPVVISGTTTLIAVSGKSIFELAGEYDTESQQQIIIEPVRPIVVVRAGLDAATETAAPADEQAALAEDAGKPVVVWENLTFTCSEEHAADRWGGAIRMEGGAMQVVNCTFTDCFADDYGGAIFAFGLERDSSITGCRFERCFADGMYGYGGAIYASSKVVGHAEVDARVRLMVGSSTFANNAAVNGGAICTMRDANVDDLINEQPIELVISQTGFLENVAEYDGGAIFAEGPVTVKGTTRGGTVPVVPDPLPVRPIIVGAVRPTSFYGNLAGGSGGAIAMDCVVGDWFVPAKLSIGESTQFERNIASNAYEYALGGAIAHLQPGGELEVFGARFVGNEARATGFNAGLAYALGGAVYADADATVSLEKTRFFGNWAVSDSAYAYGGAGAFATGTAKVTACSFDGNGVAAPEEYYGGALDFAETTALVKDSTFRGSNVEAVDAYAAELTFTNCVIVGNATLFGDEWSDVYATDSTVDVAWTAYGSYYGEGTSPVDFDDAANHNLPESTVDIYDPAEGAEPWLCPTGYVAAAALGLVQDATDIDGVPYGSRFWGYSMGAYECHTMRDMNVGIVVTVDPEEYAWTGLPIEPHSPKVNVYDTIVGSNLVEGVDYTLTWADNVDPTDRAVVTAIGTERDYIFTSFTNFWITAYYVDSYKDDETEPFMTEMYGELSHTNVAAKIAPPEGYAYDPLTSMPTGAVRRYDGECPYLRKGQLTLVIHYYKDEGDDEVPDIYQKKMHLKVVNGWWNEELNGADKIYWVTLYGEDGKWSVDGTGKLGENPTNRTETVVLPTAGERPFTDFAASGNWWYLFDASDFTKIAAPAGLEVRSGSWPFVIFLYDRKNESAGGRGGRGGRGGSGGTTDALTDYKLRAGLRISKFAYEDGKAAGEAWASVVDETTGQTLLDELLRRTKIDVLATPSLDKGEWSVIGSPTTDGEGGWGTDERPAAETPAQMFFKLRLR